MNIYEIALLNSPVSGRIRRLVAPRLCVVVTELVQF